MSAARYDAVADRYVADFSDDQDPVLGTLVEMAGRVTGCRVLDLACGHGRAARAFARRGAVVTGLDISTALLARAEEAERAEPLGIRYVLADATAGPPPGGPPYAVVTCNFGLSDIDDLDGALSTVADALAAGGVFVFSILHPCFGGSAGADGLQAAVSGSWPSDATYYDEGFWIADGTASTLRQAVGANHRKLETYASALRRHGLWIDAIREPPPPQSWSADERRTAGRFPVFLVIRCVSSPPVCVSPVPAD
jgi:SAM-dependent methyltransferase